MSDDGQQNVTNQGSGSINQNPKPKLNPKTEKIKREYYSYLERSGISVGFQIIFNEIVGKGIK